MKLKVGGCFGSELPGYHSVGFLVNGSVLLEGGTVTSTFTSRELAAITDIVVSHVHLDHVKETIFLVDHLNARKTHSLVFNGTRDVIEGARAHIFNDVVWPDFTRIPDTKDPILTFRTIPENRFVKVGDLRVKAIRVDHTVPANGFVIREEGASIVYSGDTGPTSRIWKVAHRLPDLKALIVETSFPNGMEDLAVASGHLTPSLLEREIARVNRPEVPVYVFHMKPVFLERIAEEISRITCARVQIMHQNRTYDFR